MELTFEEAVHGCEKVISVNKLDSCASCNGSGAADGGRKTTCSTCNGQGQVVQSQGFFSVAQTCPRCKGTGSTIDKPCRSCNGEGRANKSSKVTIRVPAGVDSGARLRSTGNGEAGISGGKPGDLYCVLHVRDHEIFERDGDDLLCEVPISFVQATLGSEIEVPTLGGKARINVPAGTQSGTILRLRGKGVKNVQGYGHGDLHVRVIVEVPTRPTPSKRPSFNEFGELCDDRVNPMRGSFFEKAKKFLADPIHASILFRPRNATTSLSASEKLRPKHASIRSPTTRRRPGVVLNGTGKELSQAEEVRSDSTTLKSSRKTASPPALRDYAVSGRDQGQDDGSDHPKSHRAWRYTASPVLSERSVPIGTKPRPPPRSRSGAPFA